MNYYATDFAAETEAHFTEFPPLVALKVRHLARSEVRGSFGGRAADTFELEQHGRRTSAHGASRRRLWHGNAAASAPDPAQWWNGKQYRDGGTCDARQTSGKHERPLHLLAARLAAHTPLAEMLAVVSEEAITVLADPRARSTYDLLPGEAEALMRSKPESVPVSETRDRNLFDRSPAKGALQSGVMDNPAAAHVNAVVSIREPWRNDV